MANAQVLDAEEEAGSLSPRLAFTGVRVPSLDVWFWKRIFDLAFALAGLPVLLIAGAAILVANPFANPGPLIFTQRRMGQGGRAFTMIKFRTMRPTTVGRGPEDPVEVDRITPFGHLLRRSRIDELPQLLNVLWGDMSVVGPRPDIVSHAEHYLETVPLYARRLRVRPGITGFAQVTSGYAEGRDGAAEKARRDALYIRRASLALEAKIIVRTIVVMVSGHGAR